MSDTSAFFTMCYALGTAPPMQDGFFSVRRLSNLLDVDFDRQCRHLRMVKIESDLIEWSRHRPDLHHALARVGARLATFLFIEKMGD